MIVAFQVAYKDTIKQLYLTLLIANQVSRVIVARDGLYGNITVSISSGYPEDMYAGFTKGRVQPSVASLTFGRNNRELEFSIQVQLEILLKKVVKECIWCGSGISHRVHSTTSIFLHQSKLENHITGRTVSLNFWEERLKDSTAT